MSQIKAIVTDIEGTTSSIEFVHKVLFPYSVKILPQYLQQHSQEPEIADIVKSIKQEIGKPEADLNEVIATLMAWIKSDRKITSLKALQGYVWEYGFNQGEFEGHIYEDAARNLKLWQQQGIKLYVFSSGSVKAQKLLFAHNQAGDLSSLFSGYFDTNIGNKKEAQSYHNIAKEIGAEPENILFLSDVIAELDAASSANFQTVLLVREGDLPKEVSHQVVKDFDAIFL